MRIVVQKAGARLVQPGDRSLDDAPESPEIEADRVLPDQPLSVPDDAAQVEPTPRASVKGLERLADDDPMRSSGIADLMRST